MQCGLTAPPKLAAFQRRLTAFKAHGVPAKLLEAGGGGSGDAGGRVGGGGGGAGRAVAWEEFEAYKSEARAEMLQLRQQLGQLQDLLLRGPSASA